MSPCGGARLPDTAGTDLASRRRWCAVATASGATVDEDFPGWAALLSPAGEVVAETTDWTEQVLVVEVPRFG